MIVNTMGRKEFMVQLVHEDGSSSGNPESFLKWLLRPAQDGGNAGTPARGRVLFTAAMEALDQRLAEVSNTALHPENRQPVSAAWCG